MGSGNGFLICKRRGWGLSSLFLSLGTGCLFQQLTPWSQEHLGGGGPWCPPSSLPLHLDLAPCPHASASTGFQFSWVFCLIYPCPGNFGVNSSALRFCDECPLPPLGQGSTRCHTLPSPITTARAAVLAFYGLVSYSPRPVLTGPLAWLPASWQERHVKCRPGRGMEWRGTGLSVCLPLTELRIELLNKMRTRIDGNSEATFIQSPWI